MTQNLQKNEEVNVFYIKKKQEMSDLTWYVGVSLLTENLRTVAEMQTSSQYLR